MPRIRLFHQRLLLGRNESDLSKWEKIEETQSITEQVNSWVEETGNAIVGTSAPSIDTQWWDDTMMTKSITISVTVMYRPALSNDQREREHFPA